MNSIIKKFNSMASTLYKFWLLFFYIISIAYLEFIYCIWSFGSVSLDFIFPLIFSVFSGAVLFLTSSMLHEKWNSIIAGFIVSLLSLGYGVQIIYYCIFRTPMAIYSLGGALNAMQFGDIIVSAIIENFAAVVLVLLPVVILCAMGRRIPFYRLRPPYLFYVLLFCLGSYVFSIGCVNLTDKEGVSQRTLYYNISSPELAVKKLGLMTSMRLQIEDLISNLAQSNVQQMSSNSVLYSHKPVSMPNLKDSSNSDEESKPVLSDNISETVKKYNMLNINFNSLIENEKNPVFLEMHKYFSSVKPTEKNKYTGMYKGNNLIFIVAESFSPYVVSPELTPTLYEMSTHGFVFRNFYNPLWGVSTSDGEYVACTGLIPKTGVWSFARSGKNLMPFAMGNQFKKLGYTTKAYHNHSYKYYKRHISHPNMGYDYKGLGNGLKVKETWPESDLEMIEVTADEFIGDKPFHTYYITVSGHMNYNFEGNYMSKKNKALVSKLSYSEAAKAYIAANLEFEFAMKALLDKLEAAGIAENTVIAICADHYPYGLEKEYIDELAGHELEKNFELYKSIFILWKKGMEPIYIDKPCSSLDIIPTLSNLFGLEYDSRLLMGTDILSDVEPLVVFANQSWITDKAYYDSTTNKSMFRNGQAEDKNYIDEINRIVADKFKYSEKILDTDYYRKVLSK